MLKDKSRRTWGYLLSILLWFKHTKKEKRRRWRRQRRQDKEDDNEDEEEALKICRGDDICSEISKAWIMKTALAAIKWLL